MEQTQIQDPDTHEQPSEPQAAKRKPWRQSCAFELGKVMSQKLRAEIGRMVHKRKPKFQHRQLRLENGRVCVFGWEFQNGQEAYAWFELSWNPKTKKWKTRKSGSCVRRKTAAMKAHRAWQKAVFKECGEHPNKPAPYRRKYDAETAFKMSERMNSLRERMRPLGLRCPSPVCSQEFECVVSDGIATCPTCGRMFMPD